MSNPRSTAGRAGAFALHSKYDSKKLTKPARDAFNSRWDRMVDPDLKLDPAERARRAEYAKRAYFTQLALKSAKARRKAGAT